MAVDSYPMIETKSGKWHLASNGAGGNPGSFKNEPPGTITFAYGRRSLWMDNTKPFRLIANVTGKMESENRDAVLEEISTGNIYVIHFEELLEAIALKRVNAGVIDSNFIIKRYGRVYKLIVSA